jgi:hypothetical protein
VGIVIGGVAFVAIVVTIAWYLKRRSNADYAPLLPPKVFCSFPTLCSCANFFFSFSLFFFL